MCLQGYNLKSLTMYWLRIYLAHLLTKLLY